MSFSIMDDDDTRAMSPSNNLFQQKLEQQVRSIGLTGSILSFRPSIERIDLFDQQQFILLESFS